MPQPIRRHCDVNLGGITQLPDHAAALGNIVALSGYLEALLGHLLAYLTGSGAAVTMAMFHAVTSTDAQRAMLVAAAEQMLAGAELEEFRDIMSEFRTRYGERSRLVHNLWGTSPDHPDKAIWCESKDATRFSMYLASARDTEELDLFVTGPDNQLWRKCSTYTAKDLEDVHERLQIYAERVRQFVLKLQAQHPVIAARLGGGAPSDEQAIEPPPEIGQDQTHQ